MSTDSWVKSVEIGQELHLKGPDGLDAHGASLVDAHRNGLVRLYKRGHEVALEDGLLGVDIVRIK